MKGIKATLHGGRRVSEDDLAELDAEDLVDEPEPAEEDQPEEADLEDEPEEPELAEVDEPEGDDPDPDEDDEGEEAEGQEEATWQDRVEAKLEQLAEGQRELLAKLSPKTARRSESTSSRQSPKPEGRRTAKTDRSDRSPKRSRERILRLW